MGESFAESKLLAWGVSYSGSGDLETAAAAASKGLESLGMTVCRYDPAAGRVRLEAVHQGPWYRILAKTVPQLAEILIEKKEERLRITTQFRCARWYFALLLTDIFLFTAALLWTDFLLEHPSPDIYVNRLGFVSGFLGAALILVAMFMIRAWDGGRRGAAFWEPFRRAVEKDGYLEIEGSGISRRYIFASLGLVGYTGSVAVYLVSGGGGTNNRLVFPFVMPLLGLTLILVGALLIVGAAMATRRGFSLRSVPLVPGLASACALMFLGFGPLMWLAAGPGAGQDMVATMYLGRLQNYWEARQFPASWGAEKTAAAELYWQDFFRWLRIQAWLIMGCCGLTGAFSALLLRLAARNAESNQSELERMRARRNRGVYRLAIGDKPLVRRIRQLYLLAWLLLSSLLLMLFLFGLACGSAAMGILPRTSFPGLAVANSEILVPLALTGRIDQPIIAAGVRVGWIFFGSVLSLIFVFSVGDLLVDRRRLRRELEHVVASAELPPALGQIFERLCRQVGLEVALAVSTSSSPTLQAHQFGTFRPWRLVEIPKWTIESMRTPDLEALMAHELAHHFHGDCRLDNRMRLWARLTFTGDGFARALSDSFGQEARADRTTVLTFGIEARQLVRALRRLESLYDLDHLQGPARGVAPAQAARNKAERADAASRPAWSHFKAYYFEAMDLYYWHPLTEERVRMILDLDSSRGVPG